MSPRVALFFAVLAFASLFVAGCAGPNADDQVATMVAATLQASGAPTLSAEDQIATSVAATVQAQVAPTAAPVDGVIQPQSAFGDCANTGQISIAYLKDGNVWLYVQGGAPFQLTNSADATDVRISQDGCRVAYARGIPNPAFDPNVEFSGPEKTEELWAVNSDGANNHKLAGMEFFAVLPAPLEGAVYGMYRFDWQPGTHVVAFGTRQLFMGPGLLQNDDIHRVNADGGAVTTLLPAGQGGDFYFSHDGQQIAISTETSISVVNADGSNFRSDLVTFPIVITYSEYLYYPPVSWDPNDGGLMVAVPPEEGLENPVNGVYPETTLWYIPLDGTPAWEAGWIQSIWFPRQEVQFAPDNGRIAYVRQYGDPQANLTELVVAFSNGSNESPSVQSPAIYFGAWAPDSSQYLYYINEAGFHLWLGSANSPNVLPISGLTAFEAFNGQFEWVEGSTFVQLLIGNSMAELSLMDTSGSGVVIDSMAMPFVAFDVAN
jgi:hypothetical protein